MQQLELFVELGWVRWELLEHRLLHLLAHAYNPAPTKPESPSLDDKGYPDVEASSEPELFFVGWAWDDMTPGP